MTLTTGWHLYDFKTGQLTLKNLVYFDDNFDKDHIQENEANISVAFYALPETIQVEWEEYFEPWSVGIVKYDADLPEGEQVEFAGVIVKADVSFEDETIQMRVETYKSWLKRNFIYPNNIDIYSVKESATEYNEPAWNIVHALLTNLTEDPDAPKNIILPPVIPQDQIVAGDRILKRYVWAEQTTVYEAINDLFTDYKGVETWFNGEYDETNEKIMLRWGHGTKNFPARRMELNPIFIDLNNPDVEVVGYKVLKDAGSQYNSVWVSSTATREGGNFDAVRYRPGDFEGNAYNNRLPRLETSLNFDVPVSDADKSEQAFRRLEDNNTVEKVFTLNVWDDEHYYPTQIGRRIQIQGSDYMSGLQGEVRLIGTRYSSNDSEVQLDVTNIKRVYPRVPKDIEAIQAKNDTGKKEKRTVTSSGDAGNDEQYEITDYWGNEGQTGTQDLPEMYPGKLFNYTKVSFPQGQYEGRNLFDAITVCQDSKNGVYALDTAVLQYRANGSGREVTDPLYTPPTVDNAPIYIKKATLQNGNVTEFSTIGTLQTQEIFQLLPPLPETVETTQWAEGGNGTAIGEVTATIKYYRLWFSPYVVGQRLFLAIRQNARYGWNYDNGHSAAVEILYQVDVISAPINPDGTLDAFTYSHKMPQQLYPFWNSYGRMSNVQAFGSMLTGDSYGFNGINRQVMTNDYREASTGRTFYYLPALPSIAFLGLSETNYTWTFISYNLYLYAFPNSGEQNVTPVVYRIKLTPKGEIVKDSSWIETAILPYFPANGVTGQEGTRTVAVSRGNFVLNDFYNNDTGQEMKTYVLPINEDGSTGEIIEQPETVNFYGKYGAVKKMVYEDHHNFSYSQYSRPLSYAGYIYLLRTLEGQNNYTFGSVQVVPIS